MQNYSESVAYDFELFAPRSPKVVEMPQKREKSIKDDEISSNGIKTQAHTRVGAAIGAKRVAGILLFTAFFLMLLVFKIYIDVQNTEITDQIAKANTQIGQLQNEEVRLNMELENKISFGNIETKATDMGMQKQEKNQTTYVTVSQEEAAELLVTDKQKSLFAKILDIF